MIRCPTKVKVKRHGATMVEMAAVLSVFILLLFGIIEYCRMVWCQQVMINAAREGSRYAVVHTPDTDVVSDTEDRTKAAMAGTENSMTNVDVLVYKANAQGVDIGSPSDAEFGVPIVVEVQCDYKPLLPSLLMLDNTIRLKVKSNMSCEAN
jgi:hypothetical protein